MHNKPTPVALLDFIAHCCGLDFYNQPNNKEIVSIRSIYSLKN